VNRSTRKHESEAEGTSAERTSLRAIDHDNMDLDQKDCRAMTCSLVIARKVVDILQDFRLWINSLRVYGIS
jgi:hypothetical protein